MVSVFILLFIALVNGKELCPNAGKPCLPICHLKTLNYTAIPSVSFKNGTIDVEGGGLSPEERFHVFEWHPCPYGESYLPDPETEVDGDGDVYRLLRNGTVFLPNDEDGEWFRNVTEFCLDFTTDGTYAPRFCIPAEKTSHDGYDPTITLICELVSVPFLVATVWVYSVIPELKNTHGNTLRCYLCCLIVFLVTHATGEMIKWGSCSKVVCLLVGYTTYFSTVATFFWLNVMCFNMWWMFGGFGALRNNAAQRSRQNFIYYSIYAWGVPALLTGICVCLEFVPGSENSRFYPNFGLKACWFTESEAIHLFAHGPIGLTIIGNVFFFISTSIKISQHNSNGHPNKTNSSSNGNRQHHQNTNLYFKLFIVMGIVWTSEMMGWWLKEPELLLFCVEIMNALQGIVIFVILACKKNIFISLKKHYAETLRQAARYSRPFRCCVTIEENSDYTDSQESRIVSNKRDTAVISINTNSSQLAQ